MHVLIGVMLLVAAGAAQAQCRADFDGNGTVEINELIAAVNEALGGCASEPERSPTRTPTGRPGGPPTRTPTPLTRCPFQFTDSVDGSLFCAYTGRLKPHLCAGADATGGWTTIGDQVLVVIVFHASEFTIVLDAVRTGATSARVHTASVSPDFEPRAATGTVSLPSSMRMNLTFTPGTLCGTYGSGLPFSGMQGSGAIASAIAPTDRRSAIESLRARLLD